MRRQTDATEISTWTPGARSRPAQPTVERGDRGDRTGPLERLEALCDDGTLAAIRTSATSRRMASRARPGDGVIGATGLLGGRPIACFAEDASYAGGSLGEVHADTICRVLELAGRARIPVVGFIESAGARLQEGVAALAGYGRVFRAQVALSGVVPQVAIVSGTSAGGGCYGPALTDFVFMTRDATMFLTGPKIVSEVCGEEVSGEDLGGVSVHGRNGVCQLVAPDSLAAARATRRLLGYLPQSADEGPCPCPPGEAPGRPCSAAVPAEPRRVYDVTEVIKSLCDDGEWFEISAGWARNIVCGFARLEGNPIGVVANQPRWLGGVLDAAAATKAARFVRTCDLYGIPLVVLVDTPGFLPGTRQEAEGVIRHGAKLVHAFAAAHVPRLTVILRKAFGGAFIAMNSRDLGADLVLAWPQAQLGIMGAEQAVGVLHGRMLAADADADSLRQRLATAYVEEHLTAAAAAREGVVDEVIAPELTRPRLIGALRSFSTHVRPSRPARNIPL